MHVDAGALKDGRQPKETENEKAQRNTKDETAGQNKKPWVNPETEQKQSARRRRDFGGTHKDIIEWMEEGMTTDLYRNEFEEAKLEVDDDDFTLLHRIIRRLKEDKLTDKVLRYVEEIVLQKPELLTKKVYETVPLIEAARSRTSILFRVFGLLLSRTSRDALQAHLTPCNGDAGSCPVRDVPIPDGLRRHAETKAPEGSASGTITPPPEPDAVDEKNVCLHAELDIQKILRKDGDLRRVLQEALKPLEQARKFFTNLISDRSFASSSNRIQLESLNTILDLCPDEVFVNPASGQHTPIQLAINILDKGSLDLSKLCKSIKLLVDRSPASIFLKFPVDKETKTLFQLLSEKTRMLHGTPPEVEDLERCLKRMCIEYNEGPEGDKRTEILYPDIKTAKRLHLSLCGESRVLNSKYIAGLKFRSGLEFESVLSYVKFPYWNPKPAHKTATTTTGSNIPLDVESLDNVKSPCQKDADPYIGLFEWLWERGVKEILTVDVDDNGEQPHTNRAIRKCFKGTSQRPINFHVVTWKWKKFDLCSETIFEAAPTARNVHLYSHGNTAVLRSWASEGGIAKLPELKKLVVEIRPQNDEDEKDCSEYEEEFRAQILSHCKNLSQRDLHVTIVPVSQAQGSGPEKAGTGSTQPEPTLAANHPMPKQSEWVDALGGYLEFMSNLRNTLTPKPNVKVAILDNGANLDILESQNQQGKSFHPEEDWFIGPCQHGTAMAQFVRKVCPFADLIICRLDNSGRVDSKQPFTISSCTKALQYALDMGAEIISMSWTYEKEDGSGDNEKIAFASLVREIEKHNKAILFGSHPDRGANFPVSKFGPVSLPGVIQICSATEWGEITAQNLYGNADFLFPGEKLPVEGVYDKEVKGSSFATALAAGLAALVLLSLKCSEQCGVENAQEALQIVRRHQGMRKVFKVLAKKNPEDQSVFNCFVRPNLTLEGKDTDVKEEMEKHLAKIAGRLVPQEVLEAGMSA